ncbi:pantothenate kinase [Actinobacillus equuli]|nr:pantothenate kinase [Actinobacillus equuli]
MLKEWYVHRFLKFRRSAFSDPNAYFHHYSKLSEQEAIQTASTIWDEINGLNLKQNILPSRERANLILVKGEDHAIQTVKLRNN